MYNEVGLINSDYGYSTAIGLFNSIINMLLLVGANWFLQEVWPMKVYSRKGGVQMKENM